MERLKAACVAVVMFLFVLCSAPTLLLFARRNRGRMEGVFAIVIWTIVGPGLVWLCAPLAGFERPDAVGYVALAALAVFLPLCFVAVTMGRQCDYGEGPVGSHFLRDEPTPESVGWSDMEDEYAWLFVKLIARFDLRTPAAERRAFRAAVDELMTALDGPDYQSLARISDGLTMRLLSGNLDAFHCYSYRPPERHPGERLGLLVFLHGHGNNYLFVLHALRPLCERLRLALIMPTFGYGNWEADSGVRAVQRATRFGVSAIDPDPTRVFLGGISQGGAGVSRAAEADPHRYSGLIFISPTMELGVLGSEAFEDGWRGRPVLVIQGDQDANVRPDSVTAACERMTALGVKVTEHREPDSGHFVFFAKRDEVFEVIEKWVRQVERRGEVGF